MSKYMDTSYTEFMMMYPFERKVLIRNFEYLNELEKQHNEDNDGKS